MEASVAAIILGGKGREGGIRDREEEERPPVERKRGA